jgi:integrase
MARTDERHGKGTAEWVGYKGRGCYYAKVSIPNEGRRRFRLSRPDGTLLTDREADRELAVELAGELSEHLRSEAYQREQQRLAARTTVKQFGQMWTSGDLLRRYGEVRGLKDKRSVSDDKYRLEAHVYPYIGATAVADVTEQDIERTMARAAEAAQKKRKGRPWRQATKFQLYQVLRRLFDLAVKPGRLRADNPVSTDLRPRKDGQKLYSFLYPAELQALLGCAAVPLVRRVHYALAAYTGLRKGSLAAMTWGGVDFEHGTITSLESKTDLPQIFAQSDPALPGLETLMVVLKRWHEHLGCPDDGAPVVSNLGCRPKREAATLRADLKAAGVTRELLFSSSTHVEPLRFHDMRATFVTWARRAGKGTGWIADRTGHLTEEVMRRYERGARMLADLKYQPFPDLSEALPELSKDMSNVARLGDFRRGHNG